MSGISTIRIKQADGEDWQTMRLVRADYPEGVRVSNGQKEMWVKLDQVHSEDVEHLATAFEASKRFGYGCKRVFLSAGVGIIGSFIFISLVGVLTSGSAFFFVYFYWMIIFFPALVLYLFCAGGGGILGGYIAIKSGSQGRNIYVAPAIGGIVLSLFPAVIWWFFLINFAQSF